MEQGEKTAIRIFLVAGQAILLWGLQQLIKGNRPDMLLAGCATNCAEALAMMEASAPDIILLDLDLGDENASELILSLAAASHARIIAMTRLDDEARQDEAVLHGARGILDKNASAEIFLEAISKVDLGQLWLDRAATGRIFVEFSRRGSRPSDPEQARLDALTARERSIVRCIFENSGSSARAIAEKLHISESTLRNHLTSIYGKLGIANRFELVSFAMKKGRNLVFS